MKHASLPLAPRIIMCTSGEESSVSGKQESKQESGHARKDDDDG